MYEEDKFGDYAGLALVAIFFGIVIVAGSAAIVTWVGA